MYNTTQCTTIVINAHLPFLKFIYTYTMLIVVKKSFACLQCMIFYIEYHMHIAHAHKLPVFFDNFYNQYAAYNFARPMKI
jgi:hypothetical protein